MRAGRLELLPGMSAVPIKGMGTRAQRLYLAYSLALQPNPEQQRARRIVERMTGGHHDQGQDHREA